MNRTYFSQRSIGPPTIRMSHVFAFRQLLESIGAPWHKHFAAGKLPLYCEDPNALVTLHGAWATFDSAARSEDDGFGWHVGRQVGDKFLDGRLRDLVERAPTLHMCLRNFIRLANSEASDLELGMEERQDGILFFTRYQDQKGMCGYSSSQAYQLPVYLAVLRHYLGAEWHPSEIGIEANIAPAAAKDIFPHSRISTNQQYGYILLPYSTLAAASDLPNHLVTAEPKDLRRMSFVGKLQFLLRPYLLEGIPSKKLAAELMDVSPRTLSRRLTEADLSYRQVLSELQFDLAKNYLSDSSLSISEIATRAGYDDPAHFSRTFRRIGGVTASEYRKQFH
jgi:AraC-like DNA-binding protein